MSYIDGFVIPVPTAKKQAYRDMCERTTPVFREYGALKVVECWGDDVPEGKLTSFPMAVKREPDETVVFSWIVWPSKEVRNAAMQKVMADPRMQLGSDTPFDGKRLIYGGFETLFEG
jgi:uncharacterized protein YbaA (DUF1428 family)